MSYFNCFHIAQVTQSTAQRKNFNHTIGGGGKLCIWVFPYLPYLNCHIFVSESEHVIHLKYFSNCLSGKYPWKNNVEAMTFTVFCKLCCTGRISFKNYPDPVLVNTHIATAALG